MSGLRQSRLFNLRAIHTSANLARGLKPTALFEPSQLRQSRRLQARLFSLWAIHTTANLARGLKPTALFEPSHLRQSRRL